MTNIPIKIGFSVLLDQDGVKMRNRIYELEKCVSAIIKIKCDKYVLGKWYAHFCETPWNKFSIDLYIESETDFIIASSIIRENIDNNWFDYIFRKPFPMNENISLQ